MPNFPAVQSNRVGGVGGTLANANDFNMLRNTLQLVTLSTVRLSVEGILPDTGADLTTAIQAVIDANPGKTILFDRPGVYLVNTTTSNVLIRCLTVKTDNTRLKGVPGAELKTTQNAALVFFAGPFKQGELTNWATAGHANRRWMPKLAVHDLTGTYAKGVNVLTLATAGNVANYAAGDYIFIRAGQTINFSGNDQPDGEINKVKSVNVGAGTITLEHATSKPFAQEYFPTAATGPSTTTVTAFPTLYGVANVTPYMLTGCGIEGLKLTAESLTNQAIVQFYHMWDFDYCDNIVRTSTSTMNPWGWRFGKILRNKIYLLDSAALRYAFTPGATTQNDIECAYNEWWSGGVGYCHIHEGGAKIHVHHNRGVNVGLPGLDVNAISIRGRGYDIILDHNEVFGTGTNYLLYADSTVTGGVLMDANVLDAGPAVGAVQLSHGSQRFTNTNKIINGWISRRNPTGAAFSDGFGPQPLESLQNWVSDDNQNPSLGTLPAYSVVTNVRIQVTESFNSSGTDTISVGYDAATTAFATATDVSTGGIKSPTLGALAGYNGTARDVEAYYVAGGGAPTTGRALVIVEFYRAAREVV